MAAHIVKQLPTTNNTFARRNTSVSLKTSKRSIVPISGGDSTSITLFDKPSPLDFDAFVPWVCLEWQSPQLVMIKRCSQEPYSSIRSRSLPKPIYARSMKFIHHVSKYEAKVKTGFDAPEVSAFNILKQYDEPNYPSIPVSALYDSQGNLIEISIANSPFELNCQLIGAIRVCIPFHLHLTKLSVTKGGLTSLVLHEISKILPRSNITEICLDGSHIPEGNYFELLDHPSHLKILSLNRCQLNDIICKEIAARMDFGGVGQLSILSLASNYITDTGAWFIGNMLRKNRQLLHLNLSDNRLTSNGLRYILRYLKEFPLTSEEIIEKKHRRMKFIQKRIESCDSCLEEIMQLQKIDKKQNAYAMKQPPNSKCSSARKKKSKTVKNELVSLSQVGDIMAKEMAEEFIDPFDNKNVVVKDGYHFCIGNMMLCSLNVAYNNLDYCTIQMILEVLVYQSAISKPGYATGLMKLQLDGNYMPGKCNELDEIDKLLINVITQNLQEPHVPMKACKKKSMSRRSN